MGNKRTIKFMKSWIFAMVLLALVPALFGCDGPDEATDHYKAGLEFQGGWKLEEAIGEYDAVLRLDPKRVPAYNNRGRAYHYLGRYERAIQDYDAAIRLDPQHAGAYYNRGRVYFDLGQYPQAFEGFDQAIRLDPRYGEAYAARSMAYTLLGKDAEAQQDIEQAVKLGQDGEFLAGAIDSLKMQR
jgi:tetratricopeptide (TPR) repeat protein